MLDMGEYNDTVEYSNDELVLHLTPSARNEPEVLQIGRDPRRTFTRTIQRSSRGRLLFVGWTGTIPSFTLSATDLAKIPVAKLKRAIDSMAYDDPETEPLELKGYLSLKYVGDDWRVEIQGLMLDHDLAIAWLISLYALVRP
jgi:hypothetical protein